MSSSELSAPNAEPLPEGLVEVGAYPTVKDATEHGLSILAAGHDYWLASDDADGRCRLLVEPATAAVARRHLAAYARERLRWPPAPLVDPWPARQTDLIAPLLWAALILGVHHYGENWHSAGALDAQAVFERGEGWRVFTALFLHADAAHVISNALGGAFAFTAVLATIGRVRGWLLLTVTGCTGNLLVAALNYPARYLSVGASTAIFAAVGLLTGRAVRVVARSTHPHRWRAMFVPFAAGATVLALHGGGGGRIDVGAHLCGFATGLTLGFVFGLTRPR